MPVHVEKKGKKHVVVDKKGKRLKGGTHATKKAATSHAAGANKGMGYWGSNKKHGKKGK